MRSQSSNLRIGNEYIKNITRAYNDIYRLGKLVDTIYIDVDITRAGRISDAYEALLVDDSQNPRVGTAYAYLANEINRQCKYATQMGIVFKPWRTNGQPYANSLEMMKDVRDCHRLYFYQGGAPHPFLARCDPTTGFSINHKFRAIHDLFGHAAEGYGFGPRGEENVVKA